MNALEKSRAVCGAHNTTYRKEAEIEIAKREIARHFADTPGYQPLAKINDIIQPLIVTQYKSVVTQRKIFSFPNQTFARGDVVECLGCRWLITEVDANQEIRTTGLMQQCQKEIYWQNPKTGAIHSRWATVEKPYFSNLEEDKRMSVSSREFKIQIRYDEETCLLDIGKRLMLEVIGESPKTYRITSVDSMTERYDFDGAITGFIILNVEQDAYKEGFDNVELMICDYIEPDNKPIPPSGTESVTGEITYKGGAICRTGGSFKTFTAVYKDADGNVMPVDSLTWTIDTDIPSGDLIMQENAEVIKLKVVDNPAYVGSKIALSATALGVTATLEVEVI